MHSWDALVTASAQASETRASYRASSPRRDKEWFEGYENAVRRILESPVNMVRHGIAATPSKFSKTAYMPYVESMKALWTTSDWTDLDALLAETKEGMVVKDDRIVLYHTGHGKLDEVAYDVNKGSLRVPVVDMGGLSAVKFNADFQQDLFAFEEVSDDAAFEEMDLSETERAQLRASVRDVYGEEVKYKKCARISSTTRYLVHPKDLSRALKRTPYKAAHYWDFSDKVAKRYTRKTPWVIAVQTAPEFRITWNVTPRNAPEYTLL